jgi:uncharacterized membrane protein
LGYTKMAFLQETWENDDESILILILMLIYIYHKMSGHHIFNKQKQLVGRSFLKCRTCPGMQQGFRCSWVMALGAPDHGRPRAAKTGATRGGASYWTLSEISV